ncbi:MAG: TetR family transcriptional regulator [Rhodococcus sp. (in: high G+C Gram-positive bacteria)]|uniref:TetR family transcriptional regulator n=1 Tax=Rhodococcus sp. TaxID=1831 RepID=UPI003BAEB512
MTAELRPSLRERKREQTWTALHEAAATAALEHERLADVTVDAIADKAGVSPRTFFNYFPTKEDAVLGLRTPSIGEEIAAAFTIDDDDDLVEKVTFVLFQVFRTSSGASRDRRAELTRRHPELIRKRMEHMEGVQQIVAALVADRLSAGTRLQLAEQGFDVADAAQMIVAAAGSVLRTSMRTMLAASPTSDETLILRRATALFKVVTRSTY